MRKLLFWLIILSATLNSCSKPLPEELFGIWEINTFLIDGIKRDQQYQAHDDPINWGNAVQFLADGSFRTNQGDGGQWRLSQSGELLLIPNELSDTIRWKASVAAQQLVLKSRTKRINLSVLISCPS